MESSFNYFVGHGAKEEASLALKRVNLDGTDRQTLLVIDSPLPGIGFRPQDPYSLSTISSDGSTIAISATLDASQNRVIGGLLVFNIPKATVEAVIHGPTWWNIHAQFSRSNDPVQRRDIMIQENHSYTLSTDGRRVALEDKLGADIHVIRDDGSNVRTFPWGRDGLEFCEGHECWRGASDWAITSVSVNGQGRLIESRPVDSSKHVGRRIGGVRNELSRGFENPQFHHFAVDRAGKWLISDYEKSAAAARIYLAQLGKAGEAALSDYRCIARPRPSGRKSSHMHPFLSPDGKMAFFNSDESGVVQAYMVRSLPG